MAPPDYPPRRWPGVSCPHQRVTADKPTGLGVVDGKVQARLDRRIFLADVMAPMAIGLLDAQTIHGVHAAQLEPMGAAGLDNAVEHRARPRTAPMGEPIAMSWCLLAKDVDAGLQLGVGPAVIRRR